MTRFREDTTIENIQKSKNSARRNIIDFLERKFLSFVKGTGDSIQVKILSQLNPVAPKTKTNPTSQIYTKETSLGHATQVKNGKRDFLEVPCGEQYQYSGLYSGRFLSTVQRKLKTYFVSHEVPDDLKLSVILAIFREDSFRYLTDHVAAWAKSAEDSFKEMKDKFMTPSHKDTYTTEWNTFSFE